MNHGKHVFCEKPLGTDVAQCKAAEKVIEAHPDLIFQLGFMRRFDKSYAEAKRKIDNGDIGKVVLVRSYTQDPRSTIESTLKFAPHSGGQYLDMCVHDIDLIRWFTGSDVKNVWAIGGVFEFDLYAAFHERFIKGHITLVGCPKLDGVDYSEKLTEIIRENNIKSVTVVRMEVPCCGGLEMAAKKALQQSGKFIPWQVVTVTVDGRLKEE